MNDLGFLSGDAFIETPQTTAALREIALLQRFGRTCQSARCQLLTGPSGAGKTSLIDQYTASFPPMETDTGIIQKVLRVEAPTRCGTKPLAAAILHALRDPHPSRGTEAEMNARIYHQIREQGTELLIIDEAQQVVLQSSSSATYEAANFFKGFLNQAACPILFAGLPSAGDLFQQNEQLARRARPNIVLRPFDWFTPDDQRIFRKFLRAIERLAPPDLQICALSAKDLAARIHCATGGVNGQITKLVREAWIVAQQDELPEIGQDLLAEVFEAFALEPSLKRPAFNPFRIATLPDHWETRPLDDGAKRASRRR